jgi:hypothetical protein
VATVAADELRSVTKRYGTGAAAAVGRATARTEGDSRGARPIGGRRRALKPGTSSVGRLCTTLVGVAAGVLAARVSVARIPEGQPGWHIAVPPVLFGCIVAGAAAPRPGRQPCPARIAARSRPNIAPDRQRPTWGWCSSPSLSVARMVGKPARRQPRFTTIARSGLRAVTHPGSERARVRVDRQSSSGEGEQ